MKKKTSKAVVKSVAVEVLPPVKCSTVEHLSHTEIARQIIADHETCERSSKVAAFAALRNGIRLAWVRDNGEHGDISKFMKTHLPGVGRTSCFRYVQIADAFLDEAGMKDKKTFKLTNGGKVEPLLSTQLDLFTDASANVESAVKRMIKWVNDRGLTQIYRDLSNEEPAQQLKGGARTKKKVDVEAENLESALLDLQSLISFRELGHWKLMTEEDMARLTAELNGFLKDCGDFQKLAQSSAPKKWKEPKKS